MDLAQLRSNLRTDRAPVELAEFLRTYQRTRLGVNIATATGIAVAAGRFETRPAVVPALVSMALVILLHERMQKDAPLAVKVTFDTLVYVAMAIIIDLPEVCLLVAIAQSFLVFLHVRPKLALRLMALYMSLGLAAAIATTIMETESRTHGETVLIISAVTVMVTLPAAWVLSQVAVQLIRQRDHEEMLFKETKQLLKDKDRFVASVSHELRTPLTAVVGMAHTLAETNGTVSAAERDEFTSVIVEQSEEVAAIVDDLLVAARADSGHLALVVGEVDLVEEVAGVVRDDIPIESGDQTDLVAVADPIRVRQILRNLVSNAARYGGETKRIRISRRGVMGVVVVQDDGDAIPAAQADTIFSAYGRAHDRPGRTDSVGLGLTVSRQLARMMGGDVKYSHDGKWAAFELSLPLAVTDTAQAICAAPQAALAAHGVSTR